MKMIMRSAAILAICGSGAMAGGVDRSGQNIGVIFEEGTYAEFSFGAISPSVSGTATALSPTPGASSGNMAENYFRTGAAIKHSYGDHLDIALIFDQPFGADVNYPVGTGYFASGSTAELQANAITGILKYKWPSNFSAYGGLRFQTLATQANVTLVPGGYTASGSNGGAFGYVVGAAYERPDIALRFALTYNSKISSDLNNTVETTAVLGADRTSVTEVTTPQSINLDFQTGIAKDTLLFGSVRWVDWSEFDITPADYQFLTGGSLVSYRSDRINYTLGIGRRFTKKFSGALTLGYEKAAGGFSSNLGPKDGNILVGLGGSYTFDNMKISGGIRYVLIGDAQTTLGGGVAASDFTGNKAIGVGIKVGYTF